MKKRWTLCSLLTLLFLSSTACLGPAPRLPKDSVCKDGNADQWASFNVMVRMAMMENDPYQVRDGVIWIGSMLKRCFPESFKVDE